MITESRAIAAFTGLGLVLVALALGLSHTGHDSGSPDESSTVTPSPSASSAASAAPSASAPKYPDLPSETPATFTQTFDGWDYVRREVEIPMRDGVKLHTVIVVPKGARRADPAHAHALRRRQVHVDRAESAHLEMASAADVPAEALVAHGYIRVVQDVRGKHGSEGDYVMNRPVHGPQNPTPVDHATDTYDTIDWLVKNVPESNGRVGILGTSYDGFTSAIALFEPHPALKVAVPINPMVDGWRGDDWFHNGAFRQADARIHLRPGGDAQVDAEVVDAATTTSTTRSSQARIGGRARAPSRARPARLLERSSSRIRPTTRSGAIRPWTGSSATGR